MTYAWEELGTAHLDAEGRTVGRSVKCLFVNSREKNWDKIEWIIELIEGTQGREFRAGEIYWQFRHLEIGWISPGLVSAVLQEFRRWGLIRCVNPEAYRNQARYCIVV